MNTRHTWGCLPLRLWLLGCAVALCLARSAAAFEAEDFGYRHLDPGPDRSTLLVLINYSDTGIPPGSNYWDNFMFDPTHAPEGVNAYFKEVSQGKFAWKRAGVVQIDQPASNRWINLFTAFTNSYDLADQVFFTNLMSQVLASGQFDFSRYDTNRHDGYVSDSELQVIILAHGEGGAKRYVGPLVVPGHTPGWAGWVSAADTAAGVVTMGHEMSHLLGAIDLYGVWGTDQDLNTELSIMSGHMCHQDAWHKMEFGWSKPRLFPLRTGGITTLSAAQLDTNGPALLYDEAQGSSEFFLLEYRSPTCSNGSPYDRDVAGNGLVIWHVRQNPDHTIPFYVDAVYPVPASQPGWRQCDFCRGLAHVSAASRPCPATNGIHSLSKSGDYHLVVNNSTAPGEHGWRLCYKCGVLYYGPNEGASHCAASGQHDRRASSEYAVLANTDQIVGQNHWLHCTNCQTLFFPGERFLWLPGMTPSVCPASLTRGVHQPDTNTYVLLTGWSDNTVQAVSAPNLQLGGHQVWTGGTVTPNLRWYDGSATGTRIAVRPFAPGADTITVEWLTESDTWVDFNFGGPENGTFDNPFNTITEGLEAVSYGGTLHLKTGTSPESADITKRMNVEAYNGPVTIGR